MVDEIKLDVFNDTTLSIENYFRSIGSTWVMDGLYLFVLTPVAFLACISNVCSFYIFLTKKEFQTLKLFIYYRFYSLSCLVLSVTTLFSFFAYSPRYMGIRLANQFHLYRCIFMNYVGTSLILNIYLLELLMLLNRLSFFIRNERLSRYLNYKTNRVSGWILLLCFALMVPVCFQYNVVSKMYDLSNILNYGGVNSTFTYCEKNMIFYKYYGGEYILMSLSFVRDVLTLLVEIVVCVISISQFKQYTRRQMYVHKRSSIISKIQPGLRLTTMTFVFIISSIACHLISFSAIYLTSMLSIPNLSLPIVFISYFLTSARNACNMFLFYAFNKHFRINVNKMIS